MLLVGYTWVDVAFGILYVSLAVLLLFIAYKRLLSYLNRNEPNKNEYCVLYSLEKDPVVGEAVFYFTSEKAKSYSLKILDEEMNDFKTIKEAECTVGGNIVRFDSTTLADGNYYYVLVTENQKTSKKMTVRNS